MVVVGEDIVDRSRSVRGSSQEPFAAILLYCRPRLPGVRGALASSNAGAKDIIFFFVLYAIKISRVPILLSLSDSMVQEEIIVMLRTTCYATNVPA